MEFLDLLDDQADHTKRALRVDPGKDEQGAFAVRPRQPCQVGDVPGFWRSLILSGSVRLARVVVVQRPWPVRRVHEPQVRISLKQYCDLGGDPGAADDQKIWPIKIDLAADRYGLEPWGKAEPESQLAEALRTYHVLQRYNRARLDRFLLQWRH